jgi:tripartite-type tricarboxylate transporter receptor subunit TctC
MLRSFLLFLAFAAAGFAPLAQAFPVPGKPVRIIVPYPPGGQADIHARAIAPRLSDHLKVPVVVENKPGGSSIIAAMEVVKSPPDGHTLIYTISNTVSQNPHLFSRLPYDPFRDLTPVMFVARSYLVLVAAPGAPFNTVTELVDHAKRNPGKVNFASFSAGTTSHLAGEMLKQEANIDMVHVPFKGVAEAMGAFAGGHVQMMFDGPGTALANAKAGRVKLVAVALPQRAKALADVPTMHEAGLPIDSSGGLQFFGPGGMAPATRSAVNAALAAVLRDPEMVRLINDGGNELVATSADEHARLVREWYDRWGGVIRKLGLKLD